VCAGIAIGIIGTAGITGTIGITAGITEEDGGES
jgi:hypothetical protein